MLKRFSYRKKNILLLWGGSIFLLCVYPFTFKKTIQLYSDCKTLGQKNELVAGAPARIAVLEKEALRLDRLTGTQQSADSNLQQAVLGVISSYCQEYKLLLKEFPGTVAQRENGYVIETNSFVLEGSFARLQGLVYLMEQKYKTGKVASVDYIMKKDPRTNKKSLTAKVFVQNIKKAPAEGRPYK